MRLCPRRGNSLRNRGLFTEGVIWRHALECDSDVKGRKNPVLPLIYATAMVGLLNSNPHPMTTEFAASLGSVILSDSQRLRLHCVYTLTIDNYPAHNSTSAMQKDYLVDIVGRTIRDANDPDPEIIPAQITETDIFWTDGIASYSISHTTGQYSSEESRENRRDLFTSAAGTCSPA